MVGSCYRIVCSRPKDPIIFRCYRFLNNCVYCKRDKSCDAYDYKKKLVHEKKTFGSYRL